MLATTLAQRLRHLRECENLSQDDLAELMGINDRQTVSAIENGRRAVSASELVQLSQIFKVDLNVLTDSFRLLGEGKFSWRQTNNLSDDLNSFEIRAGCWIATYRELRRMKEAKAGLTMPEVRVTESMSYEDALSLGESVAEYLELGIIPAKKLHEALVSKLDTLVLFIDSIQGVSGAACRLPDLNAILINRAEPSYRRNFDLGHELFHLLTWSTFPPEHLEPKTPTGKNKRVEQLADNFASGLLIPPEVLKRFASERTQVELHAWLNGVASELGVSSLSLRWRLVNGGALSKKDSAAIQEEKLKYNGKPVENDKPRLFSQPFTELIQWAIAEGRISARRAASILDMPIDDIAELFRAYQLEVPFDL